MSKRTSKRRKNMTEILRAIAIGILLSFALDLVVAYLWVMYAPDAGEFPL